MSLEPFDFIILSGILWVFVGIPLFELFRRYYLKPKEAEAIARASLPDNASEEKIKRHTTTVKRWLR